jgi:hypothetical protein
MNTYDAIFATAGINICQDIMITVFSIPILWKLNLPVYKKANVLVMFMVGVIVIIFSLLRLPSLGKIKTSLDPSYTLGSTASTPAKAHNSNECFGGRGTGYTLDRP